MRVYISGAISGLPLEDVRNSFEMAEKQITAFGHIPVNPLKNGLSPEDNWERQMLADIELLFGCEAIYLLKGWTDSKGARIESCIASEKGMIIIEQPDFNKL